MDSRQQSGTVRHGPQPSDVIGVFGLEMHIRTVWTVWTVANGHILVRYLNILRPELTLQASGILSGIQSGAPIEGATSNHGPTTTRACHFGAHPSDGRFTARIRSDVMTKAVLQNERSSDNLARASAYEGRSEPKRGERNSCSRVKESSRLSCHVVSK